MTRISDSEHWKQFRGTDPATLALPDYHSIYYAYGFDWRKNQNLGLVITGEFGYARYMSYNIYREAKGTALKALRDVEIEPLPGNVNPFRPSSPVNAPNRNYGVHVFCRANASPALLMQPNRLTFERNDNVTLLVVILRYYLPVNGSAGGPTPNDRAGVPLPDIKAIDIRTGLPLALPPNTVPQGMPEPIFAEKLAPIFQTIVDDNLRFYHVDGAGEYDNKDNLYLLNAVNKQKDEVLLLKFKAPVYGSNNSEFLKEEVRYWSFNEGNPDTSTSWGTPDQDFREATDGLIYIAIGGIEIKEWAEAGGYNFMPWLAKSTPSVVVYRNLVTNEVTFREDSIRKVPVLSGLTEMPITGVDDPRIDKFDAKNSIGIYAPTGMKVTQEAFLKNYGGMPSPGFKA